jgi:SpoIID/LytB domain protein
MTKSKAALLCAALLAFPLLAAADEDLSKLYSDAAAPWMDGRPADAEGALKYVVYRSSDEALTSSALLDLVALCGEEGKNAEALAYLAKGEITSPDNFYIQLEKGWNLLSLEKYQDARAAFEKALSLTADQDLSSQARLGLALADAELSGPAAAIDDLRSIYTRYPYLLSPVAELIGANLERLKRRPDAINFIKDALTYDPRNIQAEIDLARLYADSDFYVPAWQTYYTLYDMDPKEPYFDKMQQKLQKYIKGRTEDLLYWVRLAWPEHKVPIPQGKGPTIRIGLYADNTGVPSLVKSFSFICAADFDLIDSRMGRIASGKNNMQWTISYDQLNRVYQITDSMGAAVQSTTNDIRIVPKTPGGVILIKNPRLSDAHGVNRGDKEVSGELTALIREKGFWLINETTVEALVSPISAQLADGSTLPEQLKAIAVLVRTRLTWLARLARHESREYNICDSAHCLAFSGLQTENDTSAAAARDTRGEILTAGGATAPVEFHRACGGFTESGVNDGGRPMPRMTPFNFYAYTLKGPPDGMLCLADDKTSSSDVYWTLLLDPKWIESRLNRSHKVGYILSLVPLARQADGRIKAIRVEGTAGSTVVEGADNISFALAAGALRSTLFSIRPVFKGKYPEFFLLRGIGTGDGNGMCLLGSHGMAKARGAKYRDILRHYFPYYIVKKGR